MSLVEKLRLVREKSTQEHKELCQNLGVVMANIIRDDLNDDKSPLCQQMLAAAGNRDSLLIVRDYPGFESLKAVAARCGDVPSRVFEKTLKEHEENKTMRGVKVEISPFETNHRTIYPQGTAFRFHVTWY
jgi:hypothetical protein